MGEGIVIGIMAAMGVQTIASDMRLLCGMSQFSYGATHEFTPVMIPEPRLLLFTSTALPEDCL